MIIGGITKPYNTFCHGESSALSQNSDSSICSGAGNNTTIRISELYEKNLFSNSDPLRVSEITLEWNEVEEVGNWLDIAKNTEDFDSDKVKKNPIKIKKYTFWDW